MRGDEYIFGDCSVADDEMRLRGCAVIPNILIV